MQNIFQILVSDDLLRESFPYSILTSDLWRIMRRQIKLVLVVYTAQVLGLCSVRYHV